MDACSVYGYPALSSTWSSVVQVINALSLQPSGKRCHSFTSSCQVMVRRMGTVCQSTQQWQRRALLLPDASTSHRFAHS
eukprot:2709884-Amphidinium_carterae.1